MSMKMKPVIYVKPHYWCNKLRESVERSRIKKIYSWLTILKIVIIKKIIKNIIRLNY